MGEAKKRKLELVIVVIVLILAALVTSLLMDGLKRQNQKSEDSRQEEETIVLELVYAYQNPQWNSAIEECVKSFHEKYPNIRINYKVNYEQKVYDDLLTEKIARNELGDIVQLKTPLGYAKSDTLGEISEDVADQVTSVYTYIGKTYGVGAVQATSGILYNKQIFNKYHLSEPKTWNDFLHICRTLKANGVTPIGVGGSDLWHMEYWVNHFFRVDVLSGNENWLQDCAVGRASWEDKEPTQMMHHLSVLFSGGYVNEDWRTTTDGSLPYKMTEGEVAMIYTGPWTTQSISQLNPEMDLGWFYVPDDDGMIYAGENLDTFWSVTKECAEDEVKYEAAMTFLKWFYSSEQYKKICQETCTFPLTKRVRNNREDLLVWESETQEDISKSFESADKTYTQYIGNEDTPQEFEKNMLMIVQEMLSDECSEKEALVRIQKVWEKYQEQEVSP